MPDCAVSDPAIMATSATRISTGIRDSTLLIRRFSILPECIADSLASPLLSFSFAAGRDG
jgi:hypothetical protein